METKQFKTVVFGGFDRDDVVKYITETAEETDKCLQELQSRFDALTVQHESLTASDTEKAEKNDTLQEMIDRLEEEQAKLQAAHDALAKENKRLAESLQQSLDELHTWKVQSSSQHESNDALMAKMEQLRADAAAYDAVRKQIGDIECEAHQRANRIEQDAKERVRLLLVDSYAHYREVYSSLSAATQHVDTELRKINVSMSQLPLSFDHSTKQIEAMVKEMIDVDETAKEEIEVNEE